MKQVLLVTVFVICGLSSLQAGMPSALPEDIDTILRLSGPADQRLQAISFFLLGIAISTVLIRCFWNLIAIDSH